MDKFAPPLASNFAIGLYGQLFRENYSKSDFFNNIGAKAKSCRRIGNSVYGIAISNLEAGRQVHGKGTHHSRWKRGGASNLGFVGATLLTFLKL